MTAVGLYVVKCLCQLGALLIRLVAEGKINMPFCLHAHTLTRAGVLHRFCLRGQTCEHNSLSKHST